MTTHHTDIDWARAGRAATVRRLSENVITTSTATAASSRSTPSPSKGIRRRRSSSRRRPPFQGVVNLSARVSEPQADGSQLRELFKQFMDAIRRHQLESPKDDGFNVFKSRDLFVTLCDFMKAVKQNCGNPGISGCTATHSTSSRTPSPSMRGARGSTTRTLWLTFSRSTK